MAAKKPRRKPASIADVFTDKDVGGFKKAFRNLLKVGDLEPSVRVGVFFDFGRDLVLIAATNEFGTKDGKIPSRSFLRSTVDENRAKYLAELGAAVEAGLDKGPTQLKKRLDKLGATVVIDIQKKIVNLKSPRNAPSTIAKKGFDDPLIDTRRLHDSIAFVVSV